MKLRQRETLRERERERKREREEREQGGVQQVAGGVWRESESMSLTVNHPMTTTNRRMGDSQICQHRARRCVNQGR